LVKIASRRRAQRVPLRPSGPGPECRARRGLGPKPSKARRNVRTPQCRRALRLSRGTAACARTVELEASGRAGNAAECSPRVVSASLASNRRARPTYGDWCSPERLGGRGAAAMQILQGSGWL